VDSVLHEKQNSSNCKIKNELKGTMETNNYIIKYSGVNRNTRTRAGVIIWIHKSIKNTVINYTYWSERVTEVKLNIGRGNLSFFFYSMPQKKE
jgi:hypothetical protein